MMKVKKMILTNCAHQTRMLGPTNAQRQVRVSWGTSRRLQTPRGVYRFRVRKPRLINGDQAGQHF